MADSDRSDKQSPEWDSQLKRIIGVVAFVVVALLIVQFRGVLPLVFTAVVVSYLLHPIADFFQDRMLGGRFRPLAVVLTFLLVLAIITVGLLFVVPALIEQIQSFIANAPTTLQNLQDWILNLLGTEINMVGTPLERLFSTPTTISTLLGIQAGEDEVLETFDVLESQIENIDALAIARYLASSVTNITGSAFNFVGGAFSSILNVVFLLSMTFYLMIDGENMIRNIGHTIPDGYEADFHRMLSELGFVWNSYLRGQIILSLIMGVVMYLLATILGIPNAIFLGIFAGFMEFIPNIGPPLAAVPAAIFAFITPSATIPGLSGLVFALIVVVLWTVLQQTEAVVLIPRIVGDSLNLHPFLVLVAVLSGISVGGIFAVLIAAPVLASMRLIGQYVYGKIAGKAPFPVNRKSAQQMQMERRPVLVQLGDYCARWVRNLMSSRAVTKRR